MALLKLVTHDGTFHTDDVFACATVSLIYKDREVEITRTRDEDSIESADIVVDVGGIYAPNQGRFDHHQKGGAGVRGNGIPYASFGLVWKAYGAQLCQNEEVAELIDERLAQAIDAHDNGYGENTRSEEPRPYVVGDIISSFRPTWQESYSNDEGFMEALNMATSILERMIIQATAYAEAAERIEEAYKQAPDKRAIELSQEYPGWNELLRNHSEPQYMIYQRSNGSWGIKGVRINEDSFALRKPLPEAWAGLRDKELQAITGVPDAVFCHNSRFLVVAESKDGIVQLLEQALN